MLDDNEYVLSRMRTECGMAWFLAAWLALCAAWLIGGGAPWPGSLLAFCAGAFAGAAWRHWGKIKTFRRALRDGHVGHVPPHPMPPPRRL